MGKRKSCIIALKGLNMPHTLPGNAVLTCMLLTVSILLCGCPAMSNMHTTYRFELQDADSSETLWGKRIWTQVRITDNETGEVLYDGFLYSRMEFYAHLANTGKTYELVVSAEGYKDVIEPDFRFIDDGSGACDLTFEMEKKE